MSHWDGVDDLAEADLADARERLRNLEIAVEYLNDDLDLAKRQRDEATNAAVVLAKDLDAVALERDHLAESAYRALGLDATAGGYILFPDALAEDIAKVVRERDALRAQIGAQA